MTDAAAQAGADTPLDDPARLAALHRAALLDSPPEEAFDRMTRLACAALRVTVAQIALVDSDRLFFKSCASQDARFMALREMPLWRSFCEHVVATGDALAIRDAREDARFAENAVARELEIVAYLGMPLRTTDGHVLGSVCVLDAQPRDWTAEDHAVLRDLAATVVTQIELRSAVREAERQAETAQHEREGKAAVLESAGEGIYGVDIAGRCTFINSAGARLLGYEPSELVGQNMHERIHHSHPDGSVYAESECPITRAFRAGQSIQIDEDLLWRADGQPFPATYSCHPTFEDHVVTGAVVTFADMTERRGIERRLAVQYAVSRILVESATLEEAALPILRAIGTGLQWGIGVLWLLDEHDRTLRYQTSWHAAATPAETFERASRDTRFTPGTGIPGHVWTVGHPLWIADVREESNFPRARTAAELGLRSAFAFPVRCAGDVVGVIEFFSDEIRAVNEALVQAATTIGNQIGQFIERQRAEAAVRASEARKSAILQVALDCIVTIDGAGRITEFNPRSEQTFGYTRDEVLGRDISELLIPRALRDQHRSGLERYLATGEPHIMGSRVEMTALRRDGTEFPIELAITAIPSSGDPAFTAFIRDISERRQIEEMRRRRTRQAKLRADVSTALTDAGTLHGILQRCAAAVAKHLDAALARIWTLDTEQRTLELQASAGISTNIHGTYSRIPVGSLTIGHIAQEHLPHFTNDLQADAFVGDKVWLQRQGFCAFAGYPLLVDDRVVGVLAMFARESLTDDTVEALASVSDAIAQGIDRKRIEGERTALLTRELEARAQAEAAQGRLAFLAEASIALASSLDYTETLGRLAHLAVPHLSDWCGIDVIDGDGQIERFAVAQSGPDQADVIRETRGGYSLDTSTLDPLVEVLRTGEPRLLADVSDAELAAIVQDEEQAHLAWAGGSPSAMIVPLIAHGRTMGALTLVATGQDRRYDVTDLALAEELARRAALAVDNAHLFLSAQTALKQVEEIALELGEQATKLDTIIEAIPDGVYVCDAEGARTRVNAHGAAMLGLSMEQALQPIPVYCELVRPQYLDGRAMPADELPLARALRGETRTDIRFICRRYTTGDEVQMLASCAPIRNGLGQITGAVTVCADITEFSRLERQKDDFLSIASHELKTPLTSLKILTQLTHRRLERAGLAESEHTVRMERAILRMERLVNDLLDSTRIESGRLALRPEQCDLTPICLQVAEEQMVAAERDVSVDVPDEAVTIYADPERISQVLTNLLSNALKYSPASTPVALRMRAEHGQAIITVRDEGGGIPTESLPYLFERFYRVPGVQVQSGSGVGLGLGLFISREIIERHHGTLRAESTVGIGSTFTVTLPLV